MSYSLLLLGLPCHAQAGQDDLDQLSPTPPPNAPKTSLRSWKKEYREIVNHYCKKDKDGVTHVRSPYVNMDIDKNKVSHMRSPYMNVENGEGADGKGKAVKLGKEVDGDFVIDSPYVKVSKNAGDNVVQVDSPMVNNAPPAKGTGNDLTVRSPLLGNGKALDVESKAGSITKQAGSNAVNVKSAFVSVEKDDSGEDVMVIHVPERKRTANGVNVVRTLPPLTKADTYRKRMAAQAQSETAPESSQAPVAKDEDIGQYVQLVKTPETASDQSDGVAAGGEADVLPPAYLQDPNAKSVPAAKHVTKKEFVALPVAPVTPPVRKAVPLVIEPARDGHPARVLQGSTVLKGMEDARHLNAAPAPEPRATASVVAPAAAAPTAAAPAPLPTHITVPIESNTKRASAPVQSAPRKAAAPAAPPPVMFMHIPNHGAPNRVAVPPRVTNSGTAGGPEVRGWGGAHTQNSTGFSQNHQIGANPAKQSLTQVWTKDGPVTVNANGQRVESTQEDENIPPPPTEAPPPSPPSSAPPEAAPNPAASVLKSTPPKTQFAPHAVQPKESVVQEWPKRSIGKPDAQGTINEVWAGYDPNARSKQNRSVTHNFQNSAPPSQPAPNTQTENQAPPANFGISTAPANLTIPAKVSIPTLPAAVPAVKGQGKQDAQPAPVVKHSEGDDAESWRQEMGDWKSEHDNTNWGDQWGIFR